MFEGIEDTRQYFDEMKFCPFCQLPLKESELVKDTKYCDIHGKLSFQFTSRNTIIFWGYMRDIREMGTDEAA